MSTSFGCFFFFCFLFYLLIMRFFFQDVNHVHRDTHCHEQLLAGWERVPLQNSETMATWPTRPNRVGDEGMTRQQAK